MNADVKTNMYSAAQVSAGNATRPRRMAGWHAFGAAVLLCGLVLSGGTALATGLDNDFPILGTGYRKEPAPVPCDARLRVRPVPGRPLPQCGVRTGIMASGRDDFISDKDFHKLLKQSLFTPAGAPRYGTLIIHMQQCCSGGMIDELDDDPAFTDFSITTAAWFAASSWGREWWGPVMLAPDLPRCWFTSAWYEAERLAPAPRGMLAAYRAALGSPIYPQAAWRPFQPLVRLLQWHDVRENERPQYFSRGAGADGTTLGQGVNNYALLFVGPDNDGNRRGQRHWDDAVRMYNLLLLRGYPAANIHVLYADGTPPPRIAPPLFFPPGFAALPIHGAGTRANLKARLNVIGGALAAGRTDQVFIWVSDHGTRKAGFVKGKFKPRRLAVLGEEYTAELDLDADEVLTVLKEARGYAAPFLQFEGIELPEGLSAEVQVTLNGSDVGTLVVAGAGLPGEEVELDPLILAVDPADLLPGDGNTLVLSVVGAAGDELVFGEVMLGIVVNTAPLPQDAGDMNCDGRIDFDDIDGFILALLGESAYAAVYPDCNYLNGDANGDTEVSFEDIDYFVNLLTGVPPAH